MDEALHETLWLIPSGGATAYDLHSKIPGVSPNAQNNRLEKLRGLGVVTRIREGKFWRYTRTKVIKNHMGVAKK